MDSHVDYPSAKRRRTSESRSTSRSRSPSRTPTRSRRDSPRARSRSYSRSRSRSPAGRRRHSPSESCHYATPRRSRSRDGSQYKSRSLSPVVRNRGSMSNPSNRRLRFLPLQTLPRAHVRGITCAKFSPDGALLATASADATINIYSVPSNPSLPSSTSPEKQETPPHSEFKHIRTLRGHLAGVNALSWSPISTGSAAAPITTAGAAARTVTPADATNTNNKFYTLASASDDKTIMLWSPLSSDTPISPSPLTGHSNYVSTLCFSPKGNMLVSGSYDEAVWLWDVRSGRCMRQLPAHSDPVRGVDFICDGTMVCSCSTDGLIRIWDSGTGQCLQTLVDEDRKGVTGVLWAPNGRYLLAWTLDACVRLWDYVGGRCVKTYQGHVNGEFSLGGAIGTYFLGSGGDEAETDAPEAQAAFVASGSEDGDVVVWDVTTKEVLWRGEGHRDVVLSVDCTQSKDGGRGLMVSVGRDRALKVWIEDVDDQALHKRKARLLHQQHYQQHNHGAELNGHFGGYAVDEDEDVDAQILEMEGQHQHQHHDEDMEVEVTVNGGGGGGRDNGHAMEIDTAA